ncbi:glycosyltransferase family 1 protein [Anaerocolumna aminovalerica]|uniref:glycosyltransferase family 1 protein n=1 Tax=Anaerocolumna aminovalerica TaxID=1527 RepID=UPI001C0EAA3B|nr:glycosyltransferase family 1 protein [Anaerocolumna aminovalerica]MBU5331134.1 glycosyltransferase family 1 protein [Anaerocolumna aminovalerica]
MSEAIRILQVFAQMNRGGAETMIMNLYRNIDRTKIQFDFIVHTEEKCAFDDEIERLGGKIYRVPRYTGKNHFFYISTWKSFIQQHPEYKIIHGHVRSTASLYLKVCKRYGRQTIIHSHGISSGTGLSSIVKDLLQYPIRYIADYFLACSKSAGTWLFGEKIVASKKFHVLNNAIDSNSFRFNKQVRNKIRKEFNIEGKYVIGHIGRFHPYKNHTFLIDIFKSVHLKNKNAILLLVGDGDLKESLKEKVEKENLSDSVIFTGIRSDVQDLLQGMDLFLFPSLFEGLGIVVVEAQAAGLKCIVSEIIPEEAIMSNLVSKVSLFESPDFWCEKVLERVNYERKDTIELIKSAGYDIKDTAKWLENFYMELR